MRKTFTAEFKVKAVLEILKGNKSISQLASELDVHPNQREMGIQAIYPGPNLRKRN